VRINEEEWEEGVSGGDEEKRILEVLEDVGKGGIDMKGISEESGIKWVWSRVSKLVESGKIERKKFGKKYNYRLV